MQVAFESDDEVRGVAAAQVIGKEPGVEVRVGDGDAHLVLDRGDRLSMNFQSAERSDLDLGSVGFGRGLVELLPQESLEVVAGADAFGVSGTVDGHDEPVASRIDHSTGHGFERGGALPDVVRSARRRVEGATEAVLVVVVSAFESGKASDFGVDGSLHRIPFLHKPFFHCAYVQVLPVGGFLAVLNPYDAVL